MGGKHDRVLVDKKAGSHNIRHTSGSLCNKFGFCVEIREIQKLLLCSPKSLIAPPN